MENLSPGYRYAPNHGRPWTPEEDAVALLPISRREAAVRLGRTTKGVMQRVDTLRKANKETSNV